MGRTAARLWTRLRVFVRYRRAQLTLSLRVTIAALVALVFAQLLQLPLPLWAVLTAVIVTQVSVGRSLKATVDYLLGTLGGAIYGGTIAVLIPHASEIALLMVLALAVAPLTFIGAINPRFSTAPITAIIVLLIPIMTHVGPVASALDRVIEVALGGVTGLVVSFLLFPANAHRLVAVAAARTLDEMARVLGQLLAGLTQGLDRIRSTVFRTASGKLWSNSMRWGPRPSKSGRRASSPGLTPGRCCGRCCDYAMTW